MWREATKLRLKLWDCDSYEVISTLAGHATEILAMALSQADRYGCFYAELLGKPSLVGGLDHDSYIFPYIGNNHPNWLIFFRGIETTNQICAV